MQHTTACTSGKAKHFLGTLYGNGNKWFQPKGSSLSLFCVEKKRKDYAFRRQFNEKPSIIIFINPKP